MVYLALALLLVTGSFGKQLVTLRGLNRQRRCCEENDILTCHSVSVDPSALEEETFELPGGISVSFIDLDQDTYHYGNGDVDVSFTLNPQKGTVSGNAQVGHMLYVLENCGSAGAVWKQFDIRNFKEEGPAIEDFVEDFNVKVDQARVENIKGPVTFTVKIYFTPDFENATPDLEEYIKNLVRVTNQGYANSGLDIRMKVHCIERATISGAYDGIINDFRNMKSSVDELRGSADAAALLVLNYQWCGRGALGINAHPITVTDKSCAIAQFTFGHELGHNLGLRHNIELDNSMEPYPYGHGHLIERGIHTGAGYRTIMAYSAPGHRKKANHYSNPNVYFSETGTATGVAGISNNARVLKKNIAAFSQNGDESETCQWKRFSIDNL